MLLGAIPIIIVLMTSCKKLCLNRKCRTLAFFGKHTISIMAFDYWAGTIGGGILKIMGLEQWLFLFLIKISLLVVGILIWTAIVKRIPNGMIRKNLQY